MPTSRWAFTADVADCFDDMLERSIPYYHSMRELIYAIGRNFVMPETTIVDIGCSNGLNIAPFIANFGACNRYALVDVSEPMLDKVRQKYENLIKQGVVDVLNMDVTKDLPDCSTSLIMSVLSLQFTPIEYRQSTIQRIYDLLTPGGAFIFVEKVIGDTSQIDRLFIDEYYNLKSKNGYSQEAIDAKRKSLEFSLVPVKEKYNADMLLQSGFKAVECFWRALNFMGFIAIKS
ncbi:MAG: methyltransferase domain-containing protein [Clostridium sp.]|nr:methyltransferase domain-containing protein [Clostridium sp.]